MVAVARVVAAAESIGAIVGAVVGFGRQLAVGWANAFSGQVSRMHSSCTLEQSNVTKMSLTLPVVPSRSEQA